MKKCIIKDLFLAPAPIVVLASILAGPVAAQTLTTLHNFTALDASGTNSEGANPNGRLVLSGDTLYGAANQGGPSGWGTVFKVNTNGAGFTSLHSFTAPDPNT